VTFLVYLSRHVAFFFHANIVARVVYRRAHSALYFTPGSSCVYAELIQTRLHTYYKTMARSKQTAKKSTGAPAPRITLQRSSSRIKRAQKLVNIASSGKRPASNRKGRSITNSITFNIQPDVPTHVLTVEVRGPVNLRADMDKDHDEVHSLFSSHFTKTNL
jgi:hypothetical protein